MASLQPGDGDTAGVGRFGGTGEDFGIPEGVGSLDRGRHVRAFADVSDTVFEQRAGIGLADFILSSTRKYDVAGHAPRTLSLVKLHAIELLRILGNPTAANLF